MNVVQKAARLSFLASIVILGLKFFAYAETGSTAVLSDALESIVNVLAAGMAFIIMRTVAKPADDDHPYGHGKLEYFSSAFEGGLIAFAGLAIAREAAISFFNGHQLQKIDLGLALSIFAAALNLLLGWYLLKVSRKYKSAALEASGHHVVSDVWSTAGTVIGLLLVKLTGLTWFDPLAAFLIAIQLLYSGYKIVRIAVSGLTDEVDESALLQLTQAFEDNRTDSTIDIHLLKIIRSGGFHHIDAHLVVPDYWSVTQTHELMERYEKAVVAAYPFDAEIAFHVDPCFQDFCRRCEMKNCSIRKNEFIEKKPFTVMGLTGKPQRVPIIDK